MMLRLLLVLGWTKRDERAEEGDGSASDCLLLVLLPSKLGREFTSYAIMRTVVRVTASFKRCTASRIVMFSSIYILLQLIHRSC